MKNAFRSLVFILASTGVAICKPPSVGTAAANRTCSLADARNRNIRIDCDLGKEQGRKVVDLLNAVLAQRDFAATNAKLDELSVVASKPAPTQSCVGVNSCLQNNGTIDQQPDSALRAFPGVLDVSSQLCLLFQARDTPEYIACRKAEARRRTYEQTAYGIWGDLEPRTYSDLSRGLSILESYVFGSLRSSL